MFCGTKLIRDRTELKVPKPRKLPSGTWFAQITVEGQRVSCSAESEEAYYIKARAIKAGLVEAARAPVRKTVQQLMDEYISAKEKSLSPGTLKAYRNMASNRWRSVADKQADKVTNWQAVIDAESELVSPKSLYNAWGLLRPALAKAGIKPEVDKIKLPSAQTEWLTAEQIVDFLRAIKGTPCELPALLALHSLRRGEIYGLRWSDIGDKTIHVQNTLVEKSGGGVVEKSGAKTEASERYVTIFIPRLRELCQQHDDEKVVTVHISVTTDRINRICKSAGLPLVGLHGLRRSFASLCHRLGIPELETMRQGGWTDYKTVHEHYIKLDAIEAKTATGRLADFFEEIDY